AGHPRSVAAWLGPTKLARAILYATVTNIVAYLPFLLMRGDVGHFIFALPVVLACSLVASRIVSMTFIPLLGYTLLRPAAGRPARGGFMERHGGLVGWAIERRFLVLALSTLVLAGGAFAGTKLRSSFFPKDISYLSYVDIYLPEDSSIAATQSLAAEAGQVVVDVTEELGHAQGGKTGPRAILRSVTTFVGGSAPRFWYSLAPQQQAPNYAQ